MTTYPPLLSTLVIFDAKYLFILAPLLTLAYLFFQSRNRQKEIIVFLLITLPLILVAGRISSLAYSNPRPFVAEHFTPLIAHSADNGFPSDHTLFTAALAACMLIFERRLGIALGIICIIVGAARVLAGVHHSVDIVGSIIIASLVTALSHYYIFPFVHRNFLKLLR
jgi:undecaprenyl-diphosphatase